MGSGEIAGLGETTMYHAHIGRLYFALLRDRRNGDFSRCRIENMFVTKKRKKERKGKNDRFLRQSKWRKWLYYK